MFCNNFKLITLFGNVILFFLSHIYPYAGEGFLANGASYEFTTYDRDNDLYGNANCAERYTGAWWYGACHWANLNGLYLYDQDDQPYAQGVVWYTWRGHGYSLKTTEMKLRPVQ